MPAEHCQFPGNFLHKSCAPPGVQRWHMCCMIGAKIALGKVTLQVLGNVKSCLSIAVSVAIFRTLDCALKGPTTGFAHLLRWIRWRNSLTMEQAFGVCTCLIGVWMYNQKARAVW